MDADGGSQRNLTNHVLPDEDPAWSPDGAKIAFSSSRDGRQHDIDCMNPDGTGVVNITRNVAWDAGPAWSPDSKQIAFMSDRDGNWEVYVMNADGTDAVRLTHNRAIDGWPTWVTPLGGYGVDPVGDMPFLLGAIKSEVRP